MVQVLCGRVLILKEENSAQPLPLWESYSFPWTLYVTTLSLDIGGMGIGLDCPPLAASVTALHVGSPGLLLSV